MSTTWPAAPTTSTSPTSTPSWTGACPAGGGGNSGLTFICKAYFQFQDNFGHAFHNIGTSDFSLHVLCPLQDPDNCLEEMSSKRRNHTSSTRKEHLLLSLILSLCLYFRNTVLVAPVRTVIPHELKNHQTSFF